MCKVERASPDTDWKPARLPGLGPENLSFLLKLLHDILPTQERVHRTNPKIALPVQCLAVVHCVRTCLMLWFYVKVTVG